MKTGITVYELSTKKHRIKSLHTELVKALLGGKWPTGKGQWWEGFGFDAVDHFELVGDELVPMDMCGDPIPGPNFKLVAMGH